MMRHQALHTEHLYCTKNACQHGQHGNAGHVCTIKGFYSRLNAVFDLCDSFVKAQLGAGAGAGVAGAG